MRTQITLRTLYRTKLGKLVAAAAIVVGSYQIAGFINPGPVQRPSPRRTYGRDAAAFVVQPQPAAEQPAPDTFDTAPAGGASELPLNISDILAL